MIKILPLSLLVVQTFAMPATTTLTLVDDPAFNRLTITVNPGPAPASTQTSTLTGTVVADLEIDPATGQVSEMTLRDGRVDASTVRFRGSVFFVTVYDITASDLSGKPFTPDPPGSVTPATGVFDASEHAFMIDQGSISGNALGNPIALEVSPDEPFTGQGSGNGTITLKSPAESGPYVTYDVLLTLPISVDDSFDADGTSVALTATGTLRAAGVVQVPRSEYLAWTIAEGIPGADPEADHNGDGVSNAFAWAYGLGKSDDASPWRPVALPAGGFEIPLPPGGTAAPIRIRVSTGLDDWADLPASRLSDLPNPIPGGQSGTVTVAPSGALREFLVLEIEE